MSFSFPGSVLSVSCSSCVKASVPSSKVLLFMQIGNHAYPVISTEAELSKSLDSCSIISRPLSRLTPCALLFPQSGNNGKGPVQSGSHGHCWLSGCEVLCQLCVDLDTTRHWARLLLCSGRGLGSRLPDKCCTCPLLFHSLSQDSRFLRIFTYISPYILPVTTSFPIFRS